MFKRIAAAVCCAALLAVIPCSAVYAETFAANTDNGGSGSDFNAQPTVVTRLADAESLASLEAGQAPNVVWMEVDASLQVVSDAGEPLGSFAEIYAQEVSGVSLPVVEPQGAAAVTALGAFVEETPVADLAVAGGAGILMQVRSEIPSARLYYTAAAVEGDALLQTQLGLANTAGAQVVVIESGAAEREAVAYYQARFKSVWVLTDGSAGQIADAVGSGAYGVIAPDAQPVYALYDRIEGAGEGTVLSRAPFIAAHRGYVGIHDENTVGAIEDAANIGATHAEIDIYRTADNQIVLHHNTNVNYNGASVPVSSLTLAQLQTIELSGGDRIPTLDEVFSSMNAGNLGDMLLIIEFKGQDAQLVNLFAQKVNEYNVLPRVVVISFFPDQLLRVRAQLPTVSTSYLLNATDGAAEQALSMAKSVDGGIDITKAALTGNYGSGTTESAYADYFRTMADRGYSSWMWTYETLDTPLAIANGVTGITTNDPNAGNQIASLNVSDVPEVSELPADGDIIEISATTYRGETRTVSARVILLGEGNGEVQAMLAAQPESGVGLLTGSVTIRAAKPSSDGGGCSSAIGFAGLGGAILLVGAAAACLLRRRAK